MISSIENLPDSAEDLKKIIAEREQYYQVFIKCLEEKVDFLQGKLFGRKSEKISTGKYLQTLLFNEVEDTADNERGYVAVPYRRPGSVEPGLNRAAQGSPRPQFLLQSLEDEYVGVHRHAD